MCLVKNLLVISRRFEQRKLRNYHFAHAELLLVNVREFIDILRLFFQIALRRPCTYDIAPGLFINLLLEGFSQPR